MHMTQPQGESQPLCVGLGMRPYAAGQVLLFIVLVRAGALLEQTTTT